MAFGKRPGPPPGLQAPPQTPPSAPAATAEAPEFPGARRVAPDLIEFGNGEPADGVARLVDYLSDAYRDDRGVHAATLLSAAGALAGFAAQQALWEGVVRPRKLAARQVFMRVTTKSGETFFFGDFLNRILASTLSGELSIWRLVAAGIAVAGRPVPDLGPLFEHCTQTVGTPAFGTPAYVKNIALDEAPQQALRHWPRVKTILVTAGKEPLHWPLEIAVATQTLIDRHERELPPEIAALIVMEAAIPMSKVDPRTVPGGIMVD